MFDGANDGDTVGVDDAGIDDGAPLGMIDGADVLGFIDGESVGIDIVGNSEGEEPLGDVDGDFVKTTALVAATSSAVVDIDEDKVVDITVGV